MKIMSTKASKSLLAVVIVGGGVVYLFRPKPVVVDRAEIQKEQHLVVYLEGEGVLQPVQEAYVAAIKGGRLDALQTQVGAHVEADAILGALETGTLSARLRSALRSYRSAEMDLSRVRALLAQGIATQQERDDATTHATVLREELEQAKTALEQSVLRSPISGVVTYLGFKKNEFVPDGGRAFAIQNMNERVLRFKIPFSDSKVFSYRDGTVQGSFPVEVASAEKENGEHFITFKLPIERVSKESDYDGLYEELQIRGSADVFTSLQHSDRLHVRIPIRTLDNVWIVSRQSLVPNDKVNLAALVQETKTSRIKKIPVQIVHSWKEKLAISPLGDDVTVLVPGFANQDETVSGNKKVAIRASRGAL